MLSNAYFVAKFRFDTAENEPAKNLKNLSILLILLAPGSLLGARSDSFSAVRDSTVQLSTFCSSASAAFSWGGIAPD